MLMNSASTSRSRLASRKPDKVTDLKLDSRLELHVLHLLQIPHPGGSGRACIPSWRPVLPEIEANLRDIREFFLPLGGDNVDVRDGDGRTALHEAVDMGNKAVVEYLVSRGADIHAQDYHGVTPFEEANQSEKRDLIAVMLGKRQGQGLEETSVAKDNLSCSMKKKRILKWGVALLNVGVELYQAVTSQEAVKSACYQRVGVVLALVCAVLSVCEMVYEARRDRVKWRRRGTREFYWFYYPGRDGRAFGTFFLWFGLVSSTVQLFLSVATLVIKRKVLNYDHTGLLLSVCYLLAQFGCRERTMRGVVKCGEHGECETEGKFAHGRWVYECHHCRMQKLV